VNARATLVQVEAVSKRFCRDLGRSLRYGVADICREIVGGSVRAERLRPGEFWAIRDVSFEVRRGEVVGIIGRNGAGKTTLLRMLNGLIKPNDGMLRVRGRVGALIALGAGFNPVLTGRENIYVNAAVLGLSAREVDRLLDAIIEFAELRDFIDTPVQSYSSGMQVRLGFSIAAHLAPDVVLVDEVLAVGDYAFREKSFARMMHLCRSGAGVIFISHNMAAILTICDRVLWLEAGTVRMSGPTEEVVSAYLAEQEEQTNRRLEEAAMPAGGDAAEVLHEQMQIRRIELRDGAGSVTTRFRKGSRLRVRVHYATMRPIPDPHFIVSVGTPRETLFVADMLRDQVAPPVLDGEGVLECVFDELPLLPGRYVVRVSVMGKTPIVKIVFPSRRAYFSVEGPGTAGNAMSLIRSAGVVRVPSEWKW